MDAMYVLDNRLQFENHSYKTKDKMLLNLDKPWIPF